MNPYYTPRGRPPIMNVLSLAQVALMAYNAGLLGGEPARMRKAEREGLETQTALAERTHEAEYGGGQLAPPELSTGYDYTTAPQGVMNLPGVGAAVLGRKPGFKERELRLREGTLGVQKEGLEIDRETIAQRKKEFATQSRLNRPPSAGEFSALRSGLPLMDERLGFAFSKAVEPWLNDMKNMANQGASLMNMYNLNRNPERWDYYKKPIMEAAEKEMVTAAKRNDFAKVAQLKKAIDLIDSPEFLDGTTFFAGCPEERKRLEREALLEERKVRATETKSRDWTQKDTLAYREKKQKAWQAYLEGHRAEIEPGTEAEVREQFFKHYDATVGAGIVPGVGVEAPPPPPDEDKQAMQLKGVYQEVQKMLAAGMTPEQIKEKVLSKKPTHQVYRAPMPKPPESLAAVGAERERIEKLKEGWRTESRAKRTEKGRKDELLKREKELSERIASLQKAIERYGRTPKREKALARLHKELEEAKRALNAR